ncbi:hypothetical protein GCM10027515_31910 [Schumannella luteola]|uniref:AAA family ATPase n=1 Tax=Schumannella luteola TaxID=472059 RepID=A0A852YIQ9_9MICO|nr:hypothetical protein [Schumannella luteola]
MTSVSDAAMAATFHDDALVMLAEARDASDKKRRKAATGAGRLLGYSAQVSPVDGTAERTRRRFRIEALAAAGIDEETPSAQRDAFLTRFDRNVAKGAGMAADSDEPPELAAIDHSRVEYYRRDAIERKLGQRAAEQSLLDAERGATDAPTYVDVAALLDAGFQAIEPDAGGIRSDGVRLLYSGTVNGLVGESEVAKSIAATCMVADELSRDGSAGWIDLDHNGAAATVARFVAAGVAPGVLRDPSRFRLVVPESRAAVLSAIEDAAGWSPTMVVIDSVGEIVPMFGGDSNSADDYTRVHREVFARLAATGAAVLVIDHLAKTALSTGYASGTGAKKRAMDGAYYGVKLVEPFRPGEGGASAFTILKDRHGGVRAKTPGETAAVFRLDSRSDAWTWEFYPGRSADERSADQLSADVAFVLALDSFPASRAALQGAVRDASSDGKAWSNERASAALKAAKERQGAGPYTFPLSGTESDD